MPKKKESKTVQVTDRSGLDMEALGDYVTKVMTDKGYSSYTVAENAGKVGPEYKIAHNTVENVKKKKWTTIKPRSIRAIAEGLGVPQDELLDIAYGRGDHVLQRLKKVEMTIDGDLHAAFCDHAKHCGRSPEKQFEAWIKRIVLNQKADSDEARIKAARAK